MWWKDSVVNEENGTHYILYKYYEITDEPCEIHQIIIKTYKAQTKSEFLEWYILNRKL